MFRPTRPRPSFTAFVTAAVVVCITATGIRSAHAQHSAIAQQSTEQLIQNTRSDDPMTRSAAACELGEREAGEAVPALVDLLADDTSIAPFSCRRSGLNDRPNSPGLEAAHALINIGQRVTAAVMEVLHHVLGAVREKAIQDEDAAVREQAAWALGAIGDPRASDGLVSALKDQSKQVREQAIWALSVLH